MRTRLLLDVHRRLEQRKGGVSALPSGAQPESPPAGLQPLDRSLSKSSLLRRSFALSNPPLDRPRSAWTPPSDLQYGRQLVGHSFDPFAGTTDPTMISTSQPGPKAVNYPPSLQRRSTCPTSSRHSSPTVAHTARSCSSDLSLTRRQKEQRRSLRRFLSYTCALCPCTFWEGRRPAKEGEGSRLRLQRDRSEN